MNVLHKILDKYHNLSLPAKAGLWFAICGFAQRGISFITVPIFTRILTTSQYGTVSVYNSWYSFLSIFCTLNLFYGGFNNGMIQYEDERDEYLSSMQGLVTSITTILFVVYLAGQTIFNSLFEMSTLLVVVMFVEILTNSALSFWSARERFEFRYKHLVIVTLAVTLLAPVLSIVMIVLLDSSVGAEAKIISHAFVIFIICGALYIHNLRKGGRFFRKRFWKFALRFNIPLLPHYLSIMALNQTDRIMISKMVSTEKAGVYSVAYSAAMILNIMVTALNNSFAPWLYGKLKKKDYDGIADVTNMLFLGLALALIILIAFAPECIRILAGKSYYEAIWIIPPVATSLYFIFMYQIFANVEFYFMKNKFIMCASLTGAVLNIILNYYGIKMFGYIAAGYTTLICYIAFGLSHYWFMRRICKDELDGLQLFDTKTIMSVAVLLGIMAGIMACLYSYTLIRYIIILAILVVIYFKRKTFMHYFKMLKGGK